MSLSDLSPCCRYYLSGGGGSIVNGIAGGGGRYALQKFGKGMSGISFLKSDRDFKKNQKFGSFIKP